MTGNINNGMGNRKNLWEAIKDNQKNKPDSSAPTSSVSGSMSNNTMSAQPVTVKSPTASNGTEVVVKYSKGTLVSRSMYVEIKTQLQKELSEKEKLTETAQMDDKAKNEIREEIEMKIEARKLPITADQRKEIIQSLMDDLTGLGPLQKALDDPQVEEVRVNRKDLVYVMIKGKKYKTDIVFDNDEHVLKIAQKIAKDVNRQVNFNQPWCDARLKNGSRVNIVSSDLALKGNSIVIRKFYDKPFGTDDLIRFGTIDERMGGIIQACVEGRLNIMVAGGTASGKTSTLNYISTLIPGDERVITIEDAAELKLQHEDWVAMETRTATQDNPNCGVEAEILLKNSLRMSPDRIIVGECRDGRVAMTMLSAMNTGHEGSMSTVHANSPRDTLTRLETMILMSNIQMPVETLRKFISTSLDLIIFQARMRDGSRRITHITEVGNLEGTTIATQDVYLYIQEGIDKETGKIIGHFEPSGVRPAFMRKLEANGIVLPKDIFMK